MTRRPTLERERALWASGLRCVAGLDEVGRGPLAGPVVAAAVVLKPGSRAIRGLRDSKLLSGARRELLGAEIRRRAVAWAIGAASVREIDRLNVRVATALACRRALERLPLQVEYVLLDGLPLPELGVPHEAVVDGDSRCHSIAAASVLAKLVRDRLMDLLGRRYPAFGWERNKGYATRRHLLALDRLGPTPHHRRSFSPVVQLDAFGYRVF
ncbi:MAG: ribonuclease HII [Gemmatimonadales bacterium]|nr:Ribonuclease HII [bacterium HR33]GIW52417.1 MAG: ribonuclease HII [Gemmatimonadales bacterium]